MRSETQIRLLALLAYRYELKDYGEYILILIELPKEMAYLLEDLKKAGPESVEIVESERLEGAGDVFQALLLLSGSTLPFVTKIVVELIRSKQHVRIKHKGTEISGLSEEKIASTLERILEESDRDIDT